jgi:hypothetical protein
MWSLARLPRSSPIRVVSRQGDLTLLIGLVSWRVETATPVISNMHKSGKAEADPLYGLFEVTVDGKPAIVEYEPDSAFSLVSVVIPRPPASHRRVVERADELGTLVRSLCFVAPDNRGGSAKPAERQAPRVDPCSSDSAA